MFRTRVLKISMLAIAFAVAGCNSKVMKGGESVGGLGGYSKGTGTVAFADVKSRVFDPRCSQCHDAGSDNGDFAHYATTLEFVTPGNSAASEIVKSLKNFGGNMPGRGGEPLSDIEVALLRDWIDSGAPETLGAQKPGAEPTPVVRATPGPTPQPTPVATPVPVPTPVAAVGFNEVKTKILDAKCSRCHDEESDDGNFTTYATTLKYVTPGNFANSELVKNLQNFGGKMPKRGQPLADTEIELLKAWIDGGALEKVAGAPAATPGPAPTPGPTPTPAPTPVVAPPAVTVPTFADVQKRIFAPNCVRCHSDARMAANFSLEQYDAIVANPRLFDPKSAEKSGLYASVVDDYMPVAKAVAAGVVRVLTPDEKNLLKDWLAAGCPK